MNKRLLNLYSLKFNPFSSQAPATALGRCVVSSIRADIHWPACVQLWPAYLEAITIVILLWPDLGEHEGRRPEESPLGGYPLVLLQLIRESLLLLYC